MNAKSLLIACLLFCSGSALAQSPDTVEKEIAVVELGPAAGHSLTGGGSNFGGDIAVEFTPIEHWLELEAGVTPLFGPAFQRTRHRSSLQKALGLIP